MIIDQDDDSLIEKYRIEPLNSQNRKKCYEIYKIVFAGPPWFEDLACSQKGCDAQFTKDERALNSNRDNIFFLQESNSEICPKCKKSLKLIDFYPEKINHQKLIDEAITLEGLVGCLLMNNNKSIGFSWGYGFPKERTESVNFPLIIPIIKNFINPRLAFYCAETGIEADYQKKGLGSALVSERIREAQKRGFQFIVNRTINPVMLKIMSNLFSGKTGKEILKDPEKGTPWFWWDINDFNSERAKKND